MRKALVMPSLLLATFCSMAAPINTATITEKVVAAALQNPFGNYLNYRIEGLCFWLHYSMGVPYVTTTLRVNEFLPDAIVSVFDHEGTNPWLYANTVIDPASKKVGDATSRSIDGMAPTATTYSGVGHGGSMEQFKEVDVIGDPALPMFFSRLSFAMIPTEAVPFEPYYASLADSYLWRDPMMEDVAHPEDLLPDVRTEGSVLDQWESIYPPEGYINQLGDYKAAAVIALRGADISHPQSRFHGLAIPDNANHNCQNAGNDRYGLDYCSLQYQELYPKSTTTAKKVFGINDALSAGTYGQGQFAQGKGNYVWVMWRHYEGCIQGGGRFIGET